MIGAVLVGLDNPYSDDPEDALLPWPKQAAGRRLMLLTGLDQTDYLNTYYRLNVRSLVPQPVERFADDLLDENGAVIRRDMTVSTDTPAVSTTTPKLELGEFIRILHTALPFATELRVVGLGTEVRKLLRLREFYVWRRAVELVAPAVTARLVAIPHPSGRCMLLNDAEERAKAGLALRQARERAENVADLVPKGRSRYYNWKRQA